MIKLLMIGHLGNDSLVKEINGKTVISFNVAHSEKFKDQQGVQKEKTTWVRCSYWTDRTAVAPYLKKGTQVFVEGYPDVDAYQNKENQPAASLNLRVFNLQLLGTAPNSQNNGATSTGVGNGLGQLEVSATAAEGSDDLPF